MFIAFTELQSISPYSLSLPSFNSHFIFFFPSHISFSMFMSLQRWRCCSVSSASSTFRVFFFPLLFCVHFGGDSHISSRYITIMFDFTIYYFHSSAVVCSGPVLAELVGVLSAQPVQFTKRFSFVSNVGCEHNCIATLLSHCFRLYIVCAHIFLCCFCWLSGLFFVWSDNSHRQKSRYIAHKHTYTHS